MSDTSSTPQASGPGWSGIKCSCDHDMYEHYMTGIKVGRCFTGCGCQEFTRAAWRKHE